MGYFYNNTASNSYRQADLYGNVENADPHRLIELLFDGLSKQLALAQVSIKNDDNEQKCNAINKALNILDGLRNALNLDVGGKLASNLDDLYEYIQNQLVLANAQSDLNSVTEVSGLITSIRDAWGGIAPKNQSAAFNLYQASASNS